MSELYYYSRPDRRFLVGLESGHARFHRDCAAKPTRQEALDAQRAFLERQVAAATAKVIEGAKQLAHWQAELDHIRLMTPTTRDAAPCDPIT